MRTRFAILVAAVLVAALPALAQNQDERPVFRSSLDLVHIDVSVLDGKRQPVGGLTAADFTVLEDGKPRPVKGFAAVTLPSRPPPADADAVWAASVPPDVVTNQAGEQDGRLVIILMDRTIPPGQPTVAARKIAEATVDALGPHDLAAVVSTSGGVPQTFTADRTRLLAAIDQRDWSTDISQEAKDLPGIDVGDRPEPRAGSAERRPVSVRVVRARHRHASGRCRAGRHGPAQGVVLHRQQPHRAGADARSESRCRMRPPAA